MIVHEILGTEEHSVYKGLEADNAGRLHTFVVSAIRAALALQRPFLSQTVIKAFNYHAIACLHTNCGEFRPCEVDVGLIMPPRFYLVQALMDDFVNEVNRFWEQHDPITLASYILWKLNLIHPFINGNGRTARVSCYYALCLRLGGQIPGDPILPELLKINHDEYVHRLRLVDASARGGSVNLVPMNELLTDLLNQQLASAGMAPIGPLPTAPSAPAPAAP